MGQALEQLFAPLDAMNREHPPHYVRFMAYFVGTIIFAAGFYTGLFDTKYIWILLVSSLYPIVSHYATRYLHDRNPIATNGLLILIDAGVCGAGFVLMQFNPVPTFLMFLIASASLMTLGGMRGWLACVAAMVVGIGIASILFGIPSFNPVLPGLEFVVIACVMAIAFVNMLAFFSFRQTRSMLHARRELELKQTESAQLSRKLSKYLPPQVWGAIFSGQTDVKLQTQRKKLTVFFSDIKGFSEISEVLQPEALTDLLNSYFTEMSRIALKYGGTIDKFVGDAILIFFGDPTSRGHKQDAVACVSMALEMRKKMKVMSKKWREYGISNTLQIRMGINTGYCTVGNFGAESRMDYTIIGKEVNLASRLESVAQANEILISETTYNLVRDIVMCRERGEIPVKGFSRPVLIFDVVDLRKELGATRSFIEQELEGFSMYVDIDKIRNYDKDRVVEALEAAAKRVREKLIV